MTMKTFKPIHEVKRGDVLHVLDFFDREVPVRVSIVEPPTNHDQRWRLWVAPIFRGDEVVSSMTFDSCESIEIQEGS